MYKRQNEASIRGTAGTTLPVQVWGESTRKKNTFYLHVFNWPADGTLKLGGFLGTVKKAWLLSDKNQTGLSHERTDKMTVQFKVPVDAPDLASSVVVVEVDDAENVNPNRPISTTTDNQLRAFDGIAVGGRFRYGDGKASRNGASAWTRDGQAMTWPVYLSAPSKFKVIAEYKPRKNSNKFFVVAGTEKISATVKSTGKGFIRHELGTINLPTGTQTIKLQTDGVPKGDLMELRALHLKPLP